MKLSSWFAYAKSQRCWPSLHSLCLAREATEGERMIRMKLRLPWLVHELVHDIGSYIYILVYIIYIYIYLFIYLCDHNWSYVFLCLLERSSDMGHGPFSNFTPIFSHPQSWAHGEYPMIYRCELVWTWWILWFYGGIPMVISCVPEKKTSHRISMVFGVNSQFYGSLGEYPSVNWHSYWTMDHRNRWFTYSMVIFHSWCKRLKEANHLFFPFKI